MIYFLCFHVYADTCVVSKLGRNQKLKSKVVFIVFINTTTTLLYLESVLGMPLGPRKKLMKAVNERKEALDNPDVIKDSRL